MQFMANIKMLHVSAVECLLQEDYYNKVIFRKTTITKYIETCFNYQLNAQVIYSIITCITL